MSVPRRWLWISLACLVCGIAAAGFGFSLDRTEPDYTIRDNVNLVLLDVSVKDAEGSYVRGLGQSNFRVAEDGHARTITHFANEDVPVTVGLVIDNSGSMRLRRTEVVTAGLAFAKESNPLDQFFVVNFNDRIYFGLPRSIPFTDQLQRLRAALYYGKPMGQTALYDAIAAALHHMEGSAREKRTLIVVSDGGDNVSHTRLSEVLALAQGSRATIYSVGLLDPLDRDPAPKGLRRLATITGGEYVRPQSTEEVLAAFQRICRDIRNRYSIGYVPELEGNRRLVHKVKVTARDSDGRKLTVLTRTSYTTELSEQITATRERAKAQ